VPERIKTIIISHEHPAIKLRTKLRAETYKCFLVGKYKIEGKGQKENKRNKLVDLIVMPSFNLATEGTDILTEKLLSPFLNQNISNFEVFVTDKDEILDFGKLKDLERD
jgi:uncharacterized protein